MLMKKVCFTGYRPEKFNFDLKKGNDKFDILMTRIKKTIVSLINDGCRVFYTGMAQGAFVFVPGFRNNQGYIEIAIHRDYPEGPCIDYLTPRS